MRKRITRAALALVLVAVLAVSAVMPTMAAGHLFKDVSGTAYYAKAVEWAYTNGIVGGIGGGKFGPTSSITRQDLVTILWRYSGSPAPGDVTPFADNSSISKYAVDAVNWAKAHKIVGGKGGNRFDPHGKATRAEVVTILYNYLNSAHTYSSKVTKNATCTATGVKTCTCTCGASYTETIPALGHSWTSKTVHHDAVTGTRDITEEWEHVWLWNCFNLNQDGIDAGLVNVGSKGHKEYYAEYYRKAGADPRDESNREYVWTWDGSGNANSAGTAMREYWTLNYGMYWSTYGAGNDIKTETRVVGSETYVITPAYDETVTTCTTCGAGK